MSTVPGKKRSRQTQRKANRKKRKLENQQSNNVAAKNQYITILGEGAVPEFVFNEGLHALKIKDVQQALLYALDIDKFPGWFFIKNKSLIKNVVVIALNSLSFDLYHKAVSEGFFRHLPLLSKKTLSVRSPGCKKRMFDGVDVLLECSKDLNKQTNTQTKEVNKKLKIDSRPDPRPPSYFILSEEERLLNGFFIEKEHPDFVSTTEFKKNQDQSINHLLAIDCEMCTTTEGLELTRISVVDDNLEVVYDSYVKPSNEILNYNTRWSGITEDILQNVTKTLPEVIEELKDIICSDTILIGHSLENDLNALKLVHSSVIDTSILYPHPRGGRYKHALKFLALKFLQRTVQENTHDSIEDAKTAMALAKLKFENGPEFGLGNRANSVSLFSVLGSHGIAASIVDVPSFYQGRDLGGASVFPSLADSQIEDLVIKEILKPNVKFVWTQFHGLESRYHTEWDFSGNLGNETQNRGKDEAGQPPIDDSMGSMFKLWDESIHKIYKQSPRNTFFMIFSGHGNILRTKREDCSLEEMYKLVERERRSFALFALKDE